MIRQTFTREDGRIHPVLRAGLIGAVLVVVGASFSAGALGPLPIRYPLALILAGVIIVSLLTRAPGRMTTLSLIAVPVWTVLIVAYCAVLSPLSPDENDAFFRYTLLLPLAAIAGALIAGSQVREWFGRALVAAALLSSLVAIIELALDVHVADRGDATAGLVRDGMTRAVVLTEHPLVLSALIVASLPFLWAMRLKWWVSAALSVLMIAGVYATGSRGGLALVAAFVVILVIVRRWPAASAGRPGLRIAVATGVALALAVVLLVSGFLQADLLTSDDPETASLQYRLVLYQKVLDSLGTHPFGWGIGGLPAGVYLVPSPFGVHDISVTIDSEIALLAFDAGIIGVLVFIALVGFLCSRWVLASPFGQSALLLAGAAFYLAIHAWTGLAVIAVLIVGGAVADGFRPRQQLN